MKATSRLWQWSDGPKGKNLMQRSVAAFESGKNVLKMSSRYGQCGVALSGKEKVKPLSLHSRRLSYAIRRIKHLVHFINYYFTIFSMADCVLHRVWHDVSRLASLHNARACRA
jgi:hypothetical protein